MTDDLERDLRDLLRRRADTIVAADLPAWSSPDPASPDRRRSFGPLVAAAAAVVLVAAILTAVIHDRTGGIGSGGSEGHANGPGAGVAAPPKLPAAPSGTRAVSSLGIQLFVPSSWVFSASCDDQVVTPGGPGADAGPPSNCPADPAAARPSVTIAAGASSAYSCAMSIGRVDVGGRSVCIAHAVTRGASSSGVGMSVTAPVPLTVSVRNTGEAAALAILQTVRAVSTDAYGCRSTPPDISAARALPPDPSFVTLCSYRSGLDARQGELLGTSGVLTAATAARLVDALDHDRSHGGSSGTCPLAIGVLPARIVVTAHYKNGRAQSVVLVPWHCGGLQFRPADGSSRRIAAATVRLLLAGMN